MRVADILQSKGSTIRTVQPDKPLSECIIEMADCDLGSLVVLDQGRLAGLLTFREVIRLLAWHHKGVLQHGASGSVADLKVCDVMEKNPICTSPQVELEDLRALMIQHHQRYLPVLERGALLGIVSFHDVARAVYEEQKFENRMLKAYIQDWPCDTHEAALSN